METLEYSLVCRLCGKQSSISIDIFDRTENHVRKINSILPIMVHEMDLLPKHMCHRCSYKLEEFHKFYVDCLKTDATLKSQLSWMREVDTKKRVGVPMVYIENILKPVDHDAYYLNLAVNNVNYINAVNYPVKNVHSDIDEGVTREPCKYCCDKTERRKRTLPAHFQNALSKCNIKTESEDAPVTESGAVKTNRLASNAFDQSSSVEISASSTTSNICLDSVESTGETCHHVRDFNGENPVNCSELKRKTTTPLDTEKLSEKRLKYDLTLIKLEKVGESEPRVLRPRRKPINYKEKSLKVKLSSPVRIEKSQSRIGRSGKNRVRNIAKEVKPTTSQSQVNTLKFEIKQELISDLEDTSLPGKAKREVGHDTSERIIPESKDLVVNVQSRQMNSKRPRGGVAFKAPSKFKSFRAVPRNGKLKLEKGNLNGVTPICHSSMHLRSDDLFLRNGKPRKFNYAYTCNRNFPSKKLQGKGMKKTPPSAKLVERIKQYCDECNISFPSKEIFKLHSCYR